MTGKSLTPFTVARSYFRRLAAAGLFGLALTTVLGAKGGQPVCETLRRFAAPDLRHFFEQKPEAKSLQARELSPELRKRGYSECYPYDFVGLGPYAPYRRLRVGRIAIPQKGGHTEDFGYDVVVHFHGKTAMSMTLAQVARGVAFVGIDLGNGSGPYSDAFASRAEWPLLRADIERALRAQSGSPDAHIRHVALSAWSAGYGAVNEILKYHSGDIDAVVLLDGLHAAWDPRLGKGSRVQNVTAGPIAPTIEYARQAMAGEKLFIFTHSEIDPVAYPSTSLTAQYLTAELGISASVLSPEAASGKGKPFGLVGAVDVGGLHVWSYRGNDKPAHCTHLTHIDRAVRDIIEPAWKTPPMDRDVPNTPAPRLGNAPPSAAPVVAPPPSDQQTFPEAHFGKSGTTKATG